jgi:MFS family permease
VSAAVPALERIAATRRNLRAITWDGAAFCVMVGAGERYLQVFALALGYGDLVSGFLATLPVLAGATLQLAGPWCVTHLGSQKKWVILCSVLQALAWVPIAVGAVVGALPAWILFASATLYWAVGFAAGPAWTSWVETLVPDRFRERYFGKRQAVCQVSIFLALVGAGVLLQASEGTGHELAVFALLFAVAACARLVSVGFLTTQEEPVPLPDDVAHVTVLDFARRLVAEPGVRTLFCIVPMQFAVQTAEPFFVPYVRTRLHADYLWYLILVAAAFLGRIVVLPAAGSLARRFGARRVLWAGALGLVPVAALWTVSPSFAWLAGVQFVAGLAWGAFELGNFLLFFEAVPHRERTSVVTAFFFVNSLAVAAGSLAGGWLLDSMATTNEAYVGLFAASTVARLVAFRFLAPLRR